MKKLLLSVFTLVLLVFTANRSFSQCAVIYASPTGTAIGDGSEASPMDLQTAFTQACALNKKHIRLLSGTYNLSSKLVVGCDDLIIDGDWEITAGVGQKNSSLVTTININSSLETGPYDGIAGTTVGYYIGIEAISRLNFRIEDITFNVKNGGTSGTAVGTTGNRGNSVYGFYFRNSNGWVLERCNMNTGSGSQGASGINGIASINGSSGTGAAFGDCDDDSVPSTGGNGGAGAGPVSGAAAVFTSGSNDNGIPGGSGASTALPRNGGGGGAGGSGGHENRGGGLGGAGGSNIAGGGSGGSGAGAPGSGYGSNGCNSTASDGRAGNPGVNGANGVNGVVLAVSTTYDFFWVPSAQSTTGTNGFGGGGGQGGGGGGGQGCTFCVDGTGGGGGGGGGGGQGGQGATGGWGSGGTFALYQFGGSGTRNNTVLVSGAAAVGGAAGIGANGGTGGTGGTGGGGNNTSTSGSSLTGGRSCGSCIEVGAGGRGGAGGNGGRGGDGGSGAAGVSSIAQLVGGATAPSNTIAAITQVITNKPLEGCTNSEIIITKDGGTWTLTGSGTYIQDLTASTSTYTNTSASALVSYSTTGSQNITINGNVYNGFIQINTNRPLPTFGSGMNNIACEGTSFLMSTPDTGAEYEWVIFGAATNSLTPTAIFTTQVASWPTPVTGSIVNYTVRLRVRSTCCGWSTPVYYNFSVQPGSPAPTATGATICAGQTATINANGTGAGNLTWYSDALGQIVLQTSPGAASAYTTGVLTQNTTYFVGESVGSCAASLTSVQVIVNPLPNTPAASSNAVCSGTNVLVNATGSGTGSLNIYNASNVLVTSIPMAGVPNQQFNLGALAAGTYVYTVRETNGTCISDPITVSVVVNAPTGAVTASISASATTICAGSTVTFTSTVTNGGATPTFQWLLNGIPVGSNNSVFSSSTLANGDLVSLQVTSSASCLATSVVTSAATAITVNPLVAPSVSISATSTSICAGGSVTFTAVPANGGATPVYDWFVNGVSQGLNASTFTTTAIANGDFVTASLTSNAPCVNPATVSSNGIALVVNPTVTPTITSAASSTTICAGSPVTFTASATNGGTAPAYQWTVNGAPVGSNNSVFTSASLANGDLVAVTLTSNALCASTSTATSANIAMTVNPLIAPSLSIVASSNTICAGGSVTFTATPTNGGAIPVYDWFVNGVSQGLNATTFTTTTLTNSATVTASLVSNASCVNPASVTSNGITMVVNPSVTPTVAVSASSTIICSGSLVSFNAAITNGGTAPAYQWLLNGSPVGANSSFYSSNSIANTDVVTLTLTSNALCATSATATSAPVVMTVSPSVLPTAFISASTNVFCAGQNVSFTSTTNNGGATPTYEWYLNGTSTGVTTNTYSSTTFANGDIVSMIMTSSASCVAQNVVISNFVTLNSSSVVPPSLVINSLSGKLCEKEVITFIATPENVGSNPTYQWMVNGVVTGPTTSIFTTSGLLANDVVSATVDALNACGLIQSATSNDLVISAVPIVDAGADVSILLGESNAIEATTSVAGSITWTPSNSLNDALILNPIATPSVTTEYTITVTSSKGCIGSDAIVITVETLEDFVINSFTPNDDGINDTWTIKHLGAYPDFNVKIFNRWGNLLYEQSGTYVPWDGKFKGKPLPAETYFYIITLNDTIDPLKGPVTIVR